MDYLVRYKHNLYPLCYHFVSCDQLFVCLIKIFKVGLLYRDRRIGTVLSDDIL